MVKVTALTIPMAAITLHKDNNNSRKAIMEDNSSNISNSKVITDSNSKAITDNNSRVITVYFRPYSKFRSSANISLQK